jgi:hypothetical protein
VFWLNLAMFLLWQTQVVEVRTSDPSHMDVLIPPPCPPQFYAPMPVGMPMPTPARSYRVEVRFTSGPKGELPPVKVTSTVRENMPAAVSSTCWQSGKQAYVATVSSAIKEVHGDRVELELTAVCSGAKSCCCKAVETVPLNTKKEIVFRGDCPEPCVAEVTVTEVTEPPAPLSVASCPPGLPCPQAPITPCAAQACCPAVPFVCQAPQAPACCPPTGGPTAGQFLPPPAGVVYAQPIACMPPPVPVQLCAVTSPARVTRTSHLSIVRQGEKSRVKMTCGDSCVTSARMTVEGGEAGPLTVAAGASCVHVTGKTWKAQAAAIEVRDDGTVTLRGHVKLTSDRIGAGASVKADELCVKVTRGTFDKIVSKGAAAELHPQVIYASPVAPMTPVSAPR